MPPFTFRHNPPHRLWFRTRNLPWTVRRYAKEAIASGDLPVSEDAGVTEVAGAVECPGLREQTARREMAWMELMAQRVARPARPAFRR